MIAKSFSKIFEGFLMSKFYRIIDQTIVAILMIPQTISQLLEVFFMFNFYKKLGKDVVRVRTMTQKP